MIFLNIFLMRPYRVPVYSDYISVRALTLTADYELFLNLNCLIFHINTKSCIFKKIQT